MSQAPIKISIHALGGQGGGVLADWIVALAEDHGWWAQSTSVPGVAQRTGATVYYIEIAPPVLVSQTEPIMALMPVPGDVDIVIAFELMEAGRAITRGLVTPDRTTLISSSHRVFAIGEKSARGDGIFSSAQVLDACRKSAQVFRLADLQAAAEASGSMISAAMYGALAGAGVLPFKPSDYEKIIAAGQRSVNSSLAAFHAGRAALHSSYPTTDEKIKPATTGAALRIASANLPAPLHETVLLGIERLLDYQGPAYANRYLSYVERVCAADADFGAHENWLFAREAARRLAVWMSYEDIPRVADLKVRGARFGRIKESASSQRHSEIVEFMHPRFEEICDILPAAVGRWMSTQRWVRRGFERWLERDWIVKTSRLRGFLLLTIAGSLRTIRPWSLRYFTEMERIDAWLTSAVNAARTNYSLGVEVLRLQRLVKGYGETHRRGLEVFVTLMNRLPELLQEKDGAERLNALRVAALNENDGQFLALLKGETANFSAGR